MYLSMSPIYRTDAVITTGMTAEDIAHLRRQEKFDSAYTLNASIGKNWYIHRQYTLGFSLEVKNILNNQDIRTGGEGDEEHRDDGDYLSGLRLEVFLHVRYDLLPQSLLPFLTANE